MSALGFFSAVTCLVGSLVCLSIGRLRSKPEVIFFFWLLAFIFVLILIFDHAGAKS